MADRRSDAWVPRLQRWAEEEPNIRLALLVGSQARAETPADPFSDIDLALFVRDAPALLADERWIGRLGPYWTSHVEATPVGSVHERRVLFSDGQDVDVAVFPHDELTALFHDAAAMTVLRRGFRTLVDKDAAMQVVPTAAPPPGLPSAAEYANLVNDFWFHLVWAAKKNRRGEWMVAADAVNGYLHALLIRTVRWHALIRGPPGQDLWHGARYFERWADPRVRRGLPPTVAGYDPTSIARSLQANRTLFGWLADELGAGLSFPNPVRDPAGLAGYLDELLAAGPDAVTSSG